MAIGVMGKKIGMTQVFDDKGLSVPVTVVQLGANVVTQKRTKEKNGYEAVQLGGFETYENRLNKPQAGLFKKNSLPWLKPLREFRVDDTSSYNVGDKIDVVELLKVGTKIDVSGTSIGKGFQGTIKKYNHGRGPMSHGSKFHRSMGSIGAGTTPGRVFRGQKMPSQMGNVTVTTRKLTVVRLDAEKNILLVKGAVPGCEGGFLEITPSITKWN
ncbi:MAG: 50S ribosomal protein L3 [Leptolyngbya sp.]|nr:50S ribosomal protein L3 [Candidatus Melainabacteria bacterium]